MRVRTLALALVVLVGCRNTPEAAPAATRYGPLMVELGRRYEVLGRASLAGRHELAAYELHEIEEMFEDDFPHAAAPSSTPPGVDLRALREAFSREHLPPLEAAVRARDAAAFRAAFEAASRSCNGCHAAVRKGFIEVPTAPGQPVPRVD